jgi:2-dehydro-3-deoxyphosphogluconate aldolase/(4S)-4-hydroxy-2-oxoglutarate aldolase
MPTGGVQGTRESLGAWFKAGVTAVGIGGDLIKKEYLDAGNFDAMAGRTQEILGLIREVRGW